MEPDFGSLLSIGQGIDRSRPVVPQVYEVVRTAIISNKLKPKQPLSEKDLAQVLDVSRTPAREALIRLRKEGLVDIFPRHGTFVSSVKVDEVYEAHVIRETLELKVVQIAAQRASERDKHALESHLEEQQRAIVARNAQSFHAADDAFHRELSRIAGLPRAWDLVDSVKLQLDRVRLMAADRKLRPEDAYADHVKIYEAVAQNDPKGAVGTLKRHLEGSFLIIKSIIRSEESALFGS